ncbi:YDG domain-containing protein, partial [Daejeonella sp.]|uniref:YDG domain-containing protein n=1 Tax=Daejeonella sp. TaxID=2805397 RepID=UPI00378344D5
MRSQLVGKLLCLLIGSMFIPIALFSQTISIKGADLFHVASGEIVSSVGGFKFVGSSGASKISFPQQTAPSNNGPNSNRILITNASAIYEIRNVGLNETANFLMDLQESSTKLLADVSIKNKTTNTNFQVSLASSDHTGFIDIPVEWTLSKVNPLSTDKYTLSFKWDEGLEPSVIISKSLYVYDNLNAKWVELSPNKITIDETQNVLTYTDYEGNLSNTKFMIAKSTLANALLSNLSTSAGAFSPGFLAATLGYSVTVPNSITEITVMPTASDVNSTIKVNTLDVLSANTSGQINLNEGSNTITIVVTAQDRITTKTYTLNITRLESIDAQNFTVETVENQTYTGSAIAPSIVLKKGSLNLIENTDYTLGYSANTNVGTAKVIITAKGNYSETREVNYVITAKNLTITGLTGKNKVYDGNSSASATGTAVLTDVIGTDDVSLSGSPVYTFANANVATVKTISTSAYTLTGSAASNYVLIQPSLTADITTKNLTITGLTGKNKVYDGNSSASATGTAVLTDVIGTDDVSLSGSPVYTFANAN